MRTRKGAHGSGACYPLPMRGSLILAMALVPLVACSFDEATPGVRGQCGATNGEPLCPADDLETGEDACWKLVECNVIPVASPEGQVFFDEPACERFFERLSAHRFHIALACVAASTCNQLRVPICLEYGDRQQ